MEREEHKQKAEAFIADVEKECPFEPIEMALGGALYTFNELGLFGLDDCAIGPDEALKIWALVETVRRRREFPDELRM